MKFLPVFGLFVCLFLVSCNGLGPIDESIMKKVTDRPDDSELVGEWGVDEISYKLLNENCQNYKGEQVSIRLNADHTFQASNLPSFIGGSISYDDAWKLRNNKGTWELSRSSGGWSIHLKFGNSIYGSELYRVNSNLVFLFFQGDPDSGDRMRFTRKNAAVEKIPELKPFDLASLPVNWTSLTPTDSGLVVFNSCDGGNRLVKIIKDNNSFKLLLHGTQEECEFEILEAVKGKNEIIYLKARWSDSKTREEFKFIWKDKAKKQAQWITTFASGVTHDFIYVADEKLSEYPVYDQPCRECWGDECDELEKK